ncbi:1-deoxy-D-xylulose-5-phosphate synthase [Leucobacter sp. CSA1]|uniref:1-deoxy-D-xylulose-5-phosphate synthase n=1 Tax=Leucobacter chromiisoli TaxID=2796471 RepID=A0A934Q625_9MICO|nr:1-deoxy-D-xylulose-5-phosphate synthase [Leucobacter chromiisoli]MBK0418063.1 1-deoxy-D-xylulose-5-phosphate synthase [Leucobacter chromiisoli]
MTILERIEHPRDLDGLSAEECRVLAAEIREFLISAVSKTGGHLGPNLGVVELTIALHRVFESPHDPIVFDTGHQSYVHKLLTGRKDFSGLRTRGGLAGYPQRSESEHDIVESSHASSSLSWADGISRAFARTGQQDRHVVAVVGDGALTGGMTWEALNNITDDNSRNLVIVVNDNGRSYAPTIGGMARFLNTVRTKDTYRDLQEGSEKLFSAFGAPGRTVYQAARGAMRGIASRASGNQDLYSNLDIKYLGPIDGHDLEAVEEALRQAKDYGRPTLVHVITEKGRGYAPAENDEADQFHAIGQIDPGSGEPLEAASGRSWTGVFRERIVELAREDERIVGITAAMLAPTGLDAFAEVFPGRVYDVGIAEQHAVTSAAGLSYGGLHPVVALYATFMNRAFDQLLMDVALHRAGVTFVLDRAGITGTDGPSHNGVWDLATLQVVPGIRIAAPRDEATLRELLGEAVAVEDGPTVVRYPKGSVGAPVPALRRTADGADVLHEDASVSTATGTLTLAESIAEARAAGAGAEADAAEGAPMRDVLFVTVGPMARVALEAAAILAEQGITSTVVDPRWVVPVRESVIDFAGDHRLLISIEDGIRVGGVGTRIRQALRDAGVDTAVSELGTPDEFPEHASRGELLADAGLTAEQIASNVAEQVRGTRIPVARPE